MTQHTVIPEPTIGLDPLAGEVRYKHFRSRDFFTNAWDSWDYARGVSNKGGITMAYRYLTSEESINVFGTEEVQAVIAGFAGCSLKDNFDRKVGREIAFERLKNSRELISADVIDDLFAADDIEVADILENIVALQGIRVELCLF